MPTTTWVFGSGDRIIHKIMRQPYTHFHFVIHTITSNHDDIRIIGPVPNAVDENNIQMSKGPSTSNAWINMTKKIIMGWLYAADGAYDTSVWITPADTRHRVVEIMNNCDVAEYAVVVAADCTPFM